MNSSPAITWDGIVIHAPNALNALGWVREINRQASHAMDSHFSINVNE